MVGPEKLPAHGVERLDEVEHLEHGEALRRRRRFVDLHAAIRRRHRLAPGGVLAGEVPLVEEPAGRPREARELACGLAAVEAVAAGAGDAVERAREIGIREPRAGARQCPAGREDRARLGVENVRRRRSGCDLLRDAGGHREPIARVTDCRCETARERHLAVRRVRFAPARDAAGDRQRARQHAAVGDLAQAARSHRLDRCARRGASAAAEVAHRVAPGIEDQPERVPADARHVRVHDRQRRGCGDRRVHRRAARLQDLHPGCRRERVRRGDEAPRGHRHRAAGLDHAAPVFGMKRRATPLLQ